jgi:hypothetical protein
MWPGSERHQRTISCLPCSVRGTAGDPDSSVCHTDDPELSTVTSWSFGVDCPLLAGWLLSAGWSLRVACSLRAPRLLWFACSAQISRQPDTDVLVLGRSP